MTTIDKPKKQRLPRLSDAEWEVMKPFWDKGPLAARDLYESLPDSSKWSYTTVKTLLSRLVKKKALDYTQVGNSYLYSPRYSREEMVKAEVKTFSQRVLDGALKPFLVSFFDGRTPSSEELKALRSMIKNLDNKSREITPDKGEELQ